MDQLKTAGRLIDEMSTDDHLSDSDLTPLDLLDYMAILGIEFSSGSQAQVAYYDAVGNAAVSS